MTVYIDANVKFSQYSQSPQNWVKDGFSKLILCNIDLTSELDINLIANSNAKFISVLHWNN